MKQVVQEVNRSFDPSTRARSLRLRALAQGRLAQDTSQSLDASGITDEIERSGRYEPLRPRVRSMDRATQANEIRSLSASPDIMLGSVHAVTETGSRSPHPRVAANSALTHPAPERSSSWSEVNANRERGDTRHEL